MPPLSNGQHFPQLKVPAVSGDVISAAVAELAEPRYAGSVVALHLALGFTLTIVSIRLVPIVSDHIGWRFALLPLAAGPLLGTVAMLKLRTLPAAVRLASGRR